MLIQPYKKILKFDQEVLVKLSNIISDFKSLAYNNCKQDIYNISLKVP